MSAKEKGIKGATIGGAFGVLAIIIAYLESPSTFVWNTDTILSCILGIPVFAAIGFGYAFGWYLGKKWFAAVCGVTITTSFLAILFSEDRETATSIVLPIMFAILFFGFIISYVPGIFIGIYEIWDESRY